MKCVACQDLPHTCGWRIRNCQLEAATSAVLFRIAEPPTLRRHEGPAGTLCTSIDYDRQTFGPGGISAVVADSLLMKQQSSSSIAPGDIAPNLSVLDRFLFGLRSLFLDKSSIGLTIAAYVRVDDLVL